MAYRGYTECLSEAGYYRVFEDGEILTGSRIDGDPVKWMHEVDTTNGYANHRLGLKETNGVTDERYFLVHAAFYDENAPKTEIGFDDKWLEDHYGNRYATKIFKYEPDLRFWTAVL